MVSWVAVQDALLVDLLVLSVDGGSKYSQFEVLPRPEVLPELEVLVAQPVDKRAVSTSSPNF